MTVLGQDSFILYQGITILVQYCVVVSMSYEFVLNKCVGKQF